MASPAIEPVSIMPTSCFQAMQVIDDVCRSANVWSMLPVSRSNTYTSERTAANTQSPFFGRCIVSHHFPSRFTPGRCRWCSRLSSANFPYLQLTP